MDAKQFKCSVALCALVLSASVSCGATHATTNFVVTAQTDEIARKVANCAEFWRRDLAVQWLGEPLPNWYRPCPITVKVGQIGAGGQTTFTFDNGEVFGWKMQVQGSLERILDSVIPHEVNHTIFASYFRRPLPRWADEGAATLFEHDSEQARQVHLLDQVVRTSRRIPLKQLLAIREYPEDMQDVLTLYAEGYSLAEYLVGIKGDQGRSTYLKFLQDAHQLSWEQAIRKHYGYGSVDELERVWTGWILAGSPDFARPQEQLLAQGNAAPAAGQPSTENEGYVIRSQSPQEAAPVKTADQSAEPGPIQSIPRQLRAGHVISEPAPVAATATTLSPTTESIQTDPRAKFYQFPDARR